MHDAPSDTRVLIVDVRSSEAVPRHPVVRPLLERGWDIRRCAPRVMEGRGLQLLVVLERLNGTPPATEA